MAGKHLSLLVHFVWSTAGREPWIGFDWQDDLFGFMGGIMKKKNAKLICAGGMFDHVHLYTSLPSTISVADLSMQSNLIHRDGFMNHFRTERGSRGKKGTEDSA